MAANVLPASGSAVTINGTELCASEWEIEFMGGLIDVTSFCDGGFSDRIAGVKDARASIRGFAPYGTLSVTAGQTLTELRLLARAAVDNVDPEPDLAALGYRMPLAVVDRVRHSAAVRDGVRYDFDAFNKGPFYYVIPT